MDALFSNDLDEHDDQNSAKKTLILIAGFGHENRDFKKQQQIKKLRRTSAVNTSVFGCEIDEQCSKRYKKYTRNQEQLPLSITTQKSAVNTSISDHKKAKK